MLSWSDAYRPLLGKTLEGVVFAPIPADTPGLAASLNAPGFWFSGIVQLAFPAEDLFLSWEQRGNDIVLAPDREQNFQAERFCDRINLSWHPPWDLYRGSILTRVETFAVEEIAKGEVIAVKHRLLSDNGEVCLWVCSGYEPEIGDGDDLFVSSQPELPVPLVPVGIF